VGFVLRRIRPDDDLAVARVIRAVMPEYGARGPGFAINDPEVDAMCAAYPAPGAVYFVVELDGEVVGGGGVGPLAGGEHGVCELRKMYFLPQARGLGAGKALLARCIDEARARGYRRIYLETLTGMDAAQRLYERFGFARLDAPMGATGHFGCDRWYALDLVTTT
jgi:putative acetyltransferase